MQRDHQLTAIDLCFGGQLPPHSANLQIILTMATTSAAAASAAAAVSAVELDVTSFHVIIKQTAVLLGRGMMGVIPAFDLRNDVGLGVSRYSVNECATNS